jgi:hypothetical protein
MKDCELISKNLCTGCTGLGEKDWIGKEKCSTYQKYSKNGLQLCKEILGKQERIKL